MPASDRGGLRGAQPGADLRPRHGARAGSSASSARTSPSGAAACDTQNVLPRGTPQQVHDHVRRNIDTFAPGGGFVFNQVHNILSEVPPANIVAMYEAAMS